MKIAVFYPKNQFVSWSMSTGLCEALTRMGHEVLPVVMPTEQSASEQRLAQVRAESPQYEALKKADLVLVSGPEHIGPWIDAVYGKQEWKDVGAPRAAWAHESRDRDDGGGIDFEPLKWITDHWFFPATQDAEFYDQECFFEGRTTWLPFGVDTEVFYPDKPLDHDGGIYGLTAPGYKQEHYDLAFIGSLYPKRRVYLQSISRHNHPPIRLGNVGIHDLGGYRDKDSAQLLADNYRSIKVFLNLPSLSRLLVSKVYEVMACGTFLLTPMPAPEGGVSKNMAAFHSGEHLIYYRPSHTGGVAQLLREWSSPEKDAEREKIAKAGCREVHARHSLEVRFEQMFAAMGITEKQKAAAN